MLRARSESLVWAVSVAALVALGCFLPPYWIFLLTTVAISALIARSVGLITLRTGLITLCQMSFAAIGGWVVSWLGTAWPDGSFPVYVMIAGAAAAPVGLVLGLATSRIRGLELAVVTLGFAAALDLVLRQTDFPGHGAGAPVVPASPFDDPRWFFALAWGVLFAVELMLQRIQRSRAGLGWAAVRMGERAAASFGVRAVSSKAGVFATGATLAGLAGGMLAGQYGLLTREVFTPLTSMVHFASAVLCGASLFSGAVLAGAMAALVPELLRRLGLPIDLAPALFAIGAFDILRRGSGGIAEQLAAGLQTRRFRRVQTQCRIGGDDPPAEMEQRVTDSKRPVLEICGLTVVYGADRILDSVSFVVGAGEVHGLIGPNGAGKSTLVDAVTGFVSKYAGTIRVTGSPIDSLPAHVRARSGIRRTFQQSRELDALTVGDYLRLAGGASGERSTAAVRSYFALPDQRVPIRLMNSGSRRVLEIAGAVASGAQLLLLDEPAAGLGDLERAVLAERVRGLPAVFGCAVLLIEHDIGFVRAAATELTVLDRGKVISNGDVAKGMKDPAVVAAYLGEEIAE